MNEQYFTDDNLTDAQRKMLYVLMNPEHVTKSITEICELAGVSRTTYYNNMESENFVNTMNRAKKAMVKSSIVPAINALQKEAKNGSFKHLELLLKMSGDYVEVTKQQIESQVTMEMKADIEAKVRAEVEQEVKIYGETVNTNVNINTPVLDLSKLTDKELEDLEKLSDIISKATVTDEEEVAHESNVDTK